LVRLDLLLLFYRSVMHRKRRDDLQLVILGLFLVVLAGVLTVSLFFVVQILAFTACALVFLLLVTLAPAASTDEGTPAWAISGWNGLWGRVRAAMDGRVALLAVGLFAGLVVLSAGLFMAIPRFELQNSLFLERFMTKKAKTGFSDRISFGDVTDIQQDSSVAVRIDVTDAAQIPADPYWRMVVLDEYRDATFRLSAWMQRNAFTPERTRAGERGDVPPRLGEPALWTFYLESGVSRYLPLTGPFEVLLFRERQNFRSAPALGLIALRNEPVSMMAYQVQGMLSGTTLPDKAFAAQLAGADGEKSTTLRLELGEEDRAKLAAVVREITQGETPSAAEFARRASQWLQSKHDYGLQSQTPAGAGDPLVRWLLSDAPGHCELFAGSLVVLARSAGFPARVVTGFRGGNWNGFSNNYTLRNSDAHAWCEVFDRESQSWLRADPTPGAASVGQDDPQLTGAQTRAVDRSWTARLDSLRVFWYRRIVNFDQSTQVETAKAVRSAVQETGRRIREWLQRSGEQFKAWVQAPWNWGRGAVTAGALLAVLGCGWVLLLAVRRVRLHAWRKHKLHPVRLEAGRWLVRLTAKSSDGNLCRDLQQLRYGAEVNWPIPTRTFARARREWRRVKRMTLIQKQP
jgi:transglutaminase-like putative cysteine protease